MLAKQVFARAARDGRLCGGRVVSLPEDVVELVCTLACDAVRRCDACSHAVLVEESRPVVRTGDAVRWRVHDDRTLTLNGLRCERASVAETRRGGVATLRLPDAHGWWPSYAGTTPRLVRVGDDAYRNRALVLRQTVPFYVYDVDEEDERAVCAACRGRRRTLRGALRRWCAL